MLELNNIKKGFTNGKSQKLIFNEFNMKINNDDFIIILGNNGSGKSTLLNLIAGFIFPEDGSIHLNGMNIMNQPAYVRSKYMSYIHQIRENNLLSKATLIEIYMLAKDNNIAYFSNRYRSKCKKELIELLGKYNIGMENRIDEQLCNLSGGEHQIFTLILITQLAKKRIESKILLLDEHTAHLDPSSSERVMSFTDKLIKEFNYTAIMVSHSLQLAEEYGNRIIALDHGEIIYDKMFDKPNKLLDRSLLWG